MYKVSVILPIYNVSQYLRQCLDSVTAQGLQEIEIICVNDGSTDNSLSIAQEYAAKDPRITIISKENGGLSRARNEGLRVATGKYVLFLDSDDYLKLDALEQLYGKAEAESLDILYFDCNPVFESEEIRKANLNYTSYYNRMGTYPGVYSGQALFTRMRKNNAFYSSACLQLIRRSLVEENRIRFYPGILHEDNLFTFQCAMLAERAGYLDEPFYQRTVHDNSITTQQKTMRHVEGYLVCYSEMLAFLRTLTLTEETTAAIESYLYYSMYRNAYNIYYSLSPEEKLKTTACGGPGVRCLLYSIRKEKNNQPNKLPSSWTVRKIQGGIRCLRDNGLAYTVRRLEFKIRKKLKLPTKAATANRNQSPTSPSCLNLWRLNPKAALQIHRLKRLMKNDQSIPMVSFIVPVYNAAQYLMQCLDSLANQTMKAIEIICVDDGSTDSSLEILRRYERSDQRIRVFTQKNQYAGAARNLGLIHAKGEYVVFVDSDDFFREDLAEKAYIKAKVLRADAVLYSAQRYHHDTGEYEDMPWILRSNQLPRKTIFSHKDFSDKFFQTIAPAPWSKMFRRQFLLETGLQFQKLKNTNDLYFVLCALSMAQRITSLNEQFVYYRIGHGASLQASKSKAPLCFIDAYMGIHKTLSETGTLDKLRRSFLNACLNNALWNLHTTANYEAKQQIYYRLKTYFFPELGLDNYSADFYFRQEDYEDLKLIQTLDFYGYIVQYIERVQKKLDTGRFITEVERKSLQFHNETNRGVTDN